MILEDFDFCVTVETLAAKCRAKVRTEQYDRLLWLYAMASGKSSGWRVRTRRFVRKSRSSSPPSRGFRRSIRIPLPQWPIEGQRELFRILGDTEGTVGVRLTDSCLMLPSKSVSGILFQDHTGHVNCALCPRENCPNRRVPFRMDTK